VDEGIIAFEKAMDQALFIFDTPSERALTANVVTAKKNVRHSSVLFMLAYLHQWSLSL